jgi:hypothetical protein
MYTDNETASHLQITEIKFSVGYVIIVHTVRKLTKRVSTEENVTAGHHFSPPKNFNV